MTSLATMRFSHHAMACDFELIVSGDDSGYVRRAAGAAFMEVDRLEQELSRFIPTSDISRINAAPLHQPTTVGLAALECLQLARGFHQQTNGAFDITVGNSLTATDRHRAVGMTHLKIDAANRTVTRLADICLDLGAIGKGYALDQIVPLLSEWGLDSLLLHAGQSTVLAVGPDPHLVHLRDPDNHDAILGQVLLEDRSLSGSGRSLHGAHIINPRTRLPATEYLATWAIAPTAAASDALSTAFMSMCLDGIASFISNYHDVCAAVVDDRRTLHRWGL